jgi:hypothetical protein
MAEEKEEKKEKEEHEDYFNRADHLSVKLIKLLHRKDLKEWMATDKDFDGVSLVWRDFCTLLTGLDFRHSDEQNGGQPSSEEITTLSRLFLPAGSGRAVRLETVTAVCLLELDEITQSYKKLEPTSSKFLLREVEKQNTREADMREENEREDELREEAKQDIVSTARRLAPLLQFLFKDTLVDCSLEW